MKKIVTLFLSLIAGVTICFAYGAKSDDKQGAISEDEIIAIFSKYKMSLPSELALSTKEMEDKLYGEWKASSEGFGYSLKYDITGGQLCDASLYISKEKYEETLNAYREPIVESYLSPIFMYYSETLGEMTEDELLNYSGIEELGSGTVGMVIFGFAFSNYSPDNYDLIPTKFILIDDYVIAVREHSFYKLEKGTRE